MSSTTVTDKYPSTGSTVDFTIPFGYSDVIFIIDQDRRVHANRAVLAMASQIFREMLEEDGEEFDMDTADYDAFLELMKVVHPPHKEIDGSNVRSLLPLAHQFEMGYVVAQCEKYLRTEEPCIGNLLLAESYQLNTLSENIQDWAVDVPLADLKKEPGFGELQRTALTMILTRKIELKKQ